jgi:RNA polymerase sigma factor (sigma-70 family)
MLGVMETQNVTGKRQTPEATDQELVEQSKRGDEAAIANLIGRHYATSLRIAQSILRNQPDSEDAVQTAYSRAFRQLHTFREEARFSTWITSIVVNQSLMHLRRHRRATLLSLEEPILRVHPAVRYIPRAHSGGKCGPPRDFECNRAGARQAPARSAGTLYDACGIGPAYCRRRGQTGTQYLRDQVTDLPRALHASVQIVFQLRSGARFRVDVGFCRIERSIL